MLLIEIVEEILERSNKSLSMGSIIRKVNEVKGRIKRNYGRQIEVSRLDLEPGLSEYPLPCPAGNIVEVLVDGKPYDQQRIHEYGLSRYYFILNKTIGIIPTPTEEVVRGLTIFHRCYSRTLSVNDLNDEPDFDPDYHMLLVWGALHEMTSGAEAAEYKARYDDLLPDYANQDPTPTQIRMVDW